MNNLNPITLLDTSIKLIGFGYKVVGTDIPDAKDVAKEMFFGATLHKALIPKNPGNQSQCGLDWWDFFDSFKIYMPNMY